MIHVHSLALLAVAAVSFEPPSVEVDGFTLRFESSKVEASSQYPGRKVSNVLLSFEVDPKDRTKSYAFEIGQRFVARDQAGSEIRVGRYYPLGGRETAFRLAGYPPTDDPERSFVFRNTLIFTLPVLDASPSTIQTLEGDLFVFDVSPLTFIFKSDDLVPNTVKTAEGAEARLFLFDQGERGAEVGFKLKLPIRSRASALGGGGFIHDQYLLFGKFGDRMTRLTSNYNGGFPKGGAVVQDDNRDQVELVFNFVKFDRKPDELRLVLPRLEYPRRLPFRLSGLKIPEHSSEPPKRKAPRVRQNEGRTIQPH